MGSEALIVADIRSLLAVRTATSALYDYGITLL